MEQSKTFEAAMKRLEEIVRTMERGELPLEDSVKQFEAGMKTLASLEEELKDMNRRLTVLQDGKEQELNVPGEQHEDI